MKQTSRKGKGQNRLCGAPAWDLGIGVFAREQEGLPAESAAQPKPSFVHDAVENRCDGGKETGCFGADENSDESGDCQPMSLCCGAACLFIYEEKVGMKLDSEGDGLSLTGMEAARPREQIVWNERGVLYLHPLGPDGSHKARFRSGKPCKLRAHRKWGHDCSKKLLKYESVPDSGQIHQHGCVRNNQHDYTWGSGKGLAGKALLRDSISSRNMAMV